MMKKVLVSGVLSAFAFLVLATPASANHSWGNYHWARTSNPFTLKLGDNVNSAWDSYLDTTSSDWSVSSVLDTVKVAGAAGRNCRPTAGRIEVCNNKYGNNGWLGLAQIWVTGGEHISQATTKVNDTYFNKPTYNTPAWKNMVMCQEVGHDFGLDHQDETFNNINLGSCMDYTDDPDGGLGGASNTDPSNEHPNQHDYAQLETIYAHLDGFTTISSQTVDGGNGKNNAPFWVAQGDFDHPPDWGQKVRDNGYVAVFERDFGMGYRLLTHVIWAVDSPQSHRAE